MSSDFTSALTSPKVRRSLRESSPSIVNIDADQKILPRERSQSHKPQRPRLSAVSIRPRTASLMRSPSRARVDCQWKAKPRISTTKPVVADSVTDNAASEPHSGSFFSWMTMTWPGSDLTSARDRHRAIAVRKRHVADDALQAGGGEQLRRADDVEDAIAVAKAAFDRDAGQNPVIGAGDDDMAAARHAPGRNQVGQQALQPLDVGGAVLPDGAEAVEAFGQQVGERGEVALHRGAFLPALVDHLHEGAEADGDEEGNDERRHGATKRRLCGEQPVIGRFCDRLRQSLDRIGLDTRVRRMRARHALDPRRRLFCTLSGRNPTSFRIIAI